MKNDRTLEEEQIKAFAIQIINGIGFMHEQNHVHRDVKMGNVLMDREGYLKLCDFGMAIKLEEGQTSKENVGSRITWAPEVIEKKDYRMMPDWWSVGIIIYQLMMKGKTPFYIDQLKGKEGEICDDDFKKLSD